VRCGFPNMPSNVLSVSIWSGIACWIAQPVVAYEEPASA
jgi:hypothetical protein